MGSLAISRAVALCCSAGQALVANKTPAITDIPEQCKGVKGITTPVLQEDSATSSSCVIEIKTLEKAGYRV